MALDLEFLIGLLMVIASYIYTWFVKRGAVAEKDIIVQAFKLVKAIKNVWGMDVSLDHSIKVLNLVRKRAED